MLKAKVKSCSKHCDLIMRVKSPRFVILALVYLEHSEVLHLLQHSLLSNIQLQTSTLCNSHVLQCIALSVHRHIHCSPFSIPSFQHCHLAHADNTILWQISKTAHSQFNVLPCTGAFRCPQKHVALNSLLIFFLVN